MRYSVGCISAFLLLISPTRSYCQNTFSCELVIPAWFNINKLKVQSFNGLKTIDHKLSSAEGQSLTISGELFSLYAGLDISYPGDSIHGELFKTYFLPPGSNKIDIGWNKGNYQIELSNAIDIENVGNAQFIQFTKKETNELTEFYTRHQATFLSNDSLLKLMEIKGELMGKKRLQFIKEHPDLFFSFRLFHREFITSKSIPADSLLETYYTIFPDSFKATVEGNEMVRVLHNRLDIKARKEVPDFTAYDINGKKVRLSKLTKGHTIINFWASWCIPCMEKFPLLQQIRQDYPDSTLRIIMISVDTDSTAFVKALKKYNLSATNIFNGKDILRSYGLVTVPELFLIDDKRRILYDFQHEQDGQLNILKEILSNNKD